MMSYRIPGKSVSTFVPMSVYPSVYPSAQSPTECSDWTRGGGVEGGSEIVILCLESPATLSPPKIASRGGGRWMGRGTDSTCILQDIVPSGSAAQKGKSVMTL